MACMDSKAGKRVEQRWQIDVFIIVFVVFFIENGRNCQNGKKERKSSRSGTKSVEVVFRFEAQNRAKSDQNII